jgi:hypothetical protein
MGTMLISLSENDIRFIIVLLSIFILIFVLAGYIGFLVKRIMQGQAKKADTMMHDAVVTRVITNTKEFRRLARRKNNRYLLKKAWFPIIILIVAVLVHILFLSISGRWDYNLFDYQSTGFSTLLFLWNFEDPSIYTQVFGLKILATWPELLNTPHFELDAIVSYIVVPLYAIGGLWYLYQIQSYIARTFRLWHLSKSVFEKSLEGFDASQNPANQAPLPPSD